MPKAGKINFLILFYIETKKINFKVKLLPGHHQDAEYSPNRIYIYIYETVQLEPPPHHQRFFQNQWTMYKNSIYKYMCPNRIYIYETVQLEPPPNHQRLFQNQWTMYKNSIYIYINICIYMYIYIYMNLPWSISCQKLEKINFVILF